MDIAQQDVEQDVNNDIETNISYDDLILLKNQIDINNNVHNNHGRMEKEDHFYYQKKYQEDITFHNQKDIEIHYESIQKNLEK